MSEIRIGMSGWTFPPWRGTFYPKGLAQKRELEYASRRLNSIELNGSFYSLQKPSSYQAWYDETPEGFVFSLKGGQFLTHIKRLKDVRIPLANFFASGILALKEKLGPILWQFPANFAYDEARFAEFFEMFPHDTEAAAEFSKECGAQMEGKSWMKTDKKRPIRYAVEVRHPSFLVPEFMKLLRKHKIAFVIGETAGKWPFAEEITSDFLYLRMHGDEALYSDGYTDEALDRWAARIKTWSSGKQPKDAKRVLDIAPPTSTPRDVFVYFDNDLKVRSPIDAMALSKRLGIKPPK
ncbi:MAG TPA: DUF72 domain-containing protein [Tepidisphaeraceae bacterium]|jgi:uncharacterized protein YecE (DUF72 family)|nr:DUF72 domain-containing protein [Tepidisphaeraceae bacterium]